MPRSLPFVCGFSLWKALAVGCVSGTACVQFFFSCTVWSHYRGASCPVGFYFPAFLPPNHALQQFLVPLASVCASRGTSGALRNPPAVSRHNRSFHAVHPPFACNVPRKTAFPSLTPNGRNTSNYLFWRGCQRDVAGDHYTLPSILRPACFYARTLPRGF